MKTKYLFLYIFLSVLLVSCNGVFNNTAPYPLKSKIDQVQPLTGLVFWTDNRHNNSDMIQLEYSYMLYNEVVVDSGVYDWSVVENLLDQVASRGHQAVLRFRYVYPGYQTAVPDYIKQRPDYHETEGESEGLTTWFPDWSNVELQRFTLEFFSKFAQRYDNDPRIAYLEVGFGLWGEYHIYDGPFELGVTFPSKQFQEQFFKHLQSEFKNLYWMISIDAAQEEVAPFVEKPQLKEIVFGLFDDSFMHKQWTGYNLDCWKFFGLDRYKIAPFGGEFSYYSDYDQRHVLDTQGLYGRTWEEMAKKYHITFMIANDQPRYQSDERIKQASMAAGYKFKITEFKADNKKTYVTIQNIGTAPIYYETYLYLEDLKSDYDLRNLMPDQVVTLTFDLPYQTDRIPQITIKCSRTLPEQTIQFEADLQ